MHKIGKTFIVSGPSGVGKSTVLHALFQGRDDLYFSVSATTRAPREGEQDGVDYHFIQADAFRDMIVALKTLMGTADEGLRATCRSHSPKLTNPSP